MAPNKAILGSSLVVTFLSGTVVGRLSETDAPPPPHTVEYVYHDAFDRFRTEGYDESELEQAKEIYREYLKQYQRWWDSVLDTHPSVAESIDQHFHERMDELAGRVAERKRGGK